MRIAKRLECLMVCAVVTVAAHADTGTLTNEQRAHYQMNWAMQIAHSVRSHHVPKGTPTKPAYVRMELTPAGEVQSALISRSSGDAAYDGSVVRAAFQSSPLPLPSNPDAFDSRITLCVPAELCPH